MTWEIVLACALIFAARLCDVSLDTLRMIAVIRGRRGLAWILGFCQVLIWIYAISFAMKNITNPVYAVTYALGFACGNFLGITLEQWLAHGDQVIRVFTRPEFSDAIAQRLRGHGFGVTVFDGRGRDGPISQLYVESTRKRVADAARLCRTMDPGCFYVIDDIRMASTTVGRTRADQPRRLRDDDFNVEPLTVPNTPPLARAEPATRAAVGAGAASGGAAK